MEERRRNLWKAMLDADMNVRYWQAQASDLARNDTGARVFAAILSSGSVASVFLSNDYPMVWKTCTVVTAITNIVLATVDPKKRIEEMTGFKQTWAEFRIDFQKLWDRRRQLTDEDYERFNQLRKDLEKRTAGEAKYVPDAELILKCQAEVRRAEGLEGRANGSGSKGTTGTEREAGTPTPTGDHPGGSSEGGTHPKNGAEGGMAGPA